MLTHFWVSNFLYFLNKNFAKNFFSKQFQQKFLWAASLCPVAKNNIFCGVHCLTQFKILWFLPWHCPGLSFSLFLSSSMMKICTLYCHRTRSTIFCNFRSWFLVLLRDLTCLHKNILPSGELQTSPNNYGLGVLSYFNCHCCLHPGLPGFIAAQHGQYFSLDILSLGKNESK